MASFALGPLDVVFDSENVVQPDFLFVSNARKSILQHRGIFGSPNAMFEIISPVTFTRDRYQKADLYAKFGVQEYWIVDPRNWAIEFYR